MTANISFNKRTYGDIQLSISRKSHRRTRVPIDPQLIFKQAELIRLKREARYQSLTGFQFEKVGLVTQNCVGKIFNPDGMIGGYLKTQSDLFVQNNAIMEKIRWDLALLAGDKDFHSPTTLLYPQLPNGLSYCSHLQVHETGEPIATIFDKNIPVPRLSLLRSLVMTVVYGGFDDHLNNMMLQDSKIIHFDNAATLSPGRKFIDWGGFYMFCFRPMILQFNQMNNPLLPEEIEFIKSELNKYVQVMPKFEVYFDRSDVQKMISNIDELVMDPKKSLSGMRERIEVALEGLKAAKLITPRQWIFSSFSLLRVALALHMVAKGLTPIDAIRELGSECLADVIDEVVSKKKDPTEIVRIAIENEDMSEIAVLLAQLPDCDDNRLETVGRIAFEFIKANSEQELKNGILEKDHLAVISELLNNNVHFVLKDNFIIWNDFKISILPNKTLVCQNSIFLYPPLTVDEFILLTQGVVSKNIVQFETFVTTIADNNIPVGSGKLHSISKIKAKMLPNSYRVFQVRGNTNDRFILSEKDAKGNVYSRDIGLDITAVYAARDKYTRIKSVMPQQLIAEFILDDETYHVRPGECVGTHVIQVGKLELPPMYPHKMQNWIQGEKKELGLLKDLNTINAVVGSPSNADLRIGEHILVQEKESSPMKFAIYQRPLGYPNMYSYSMSENRRGIRLVTETGQSFFLDRKTLITRLKNGLKLDGDAHAGVKS